MKKLLPFLIALSVGSFSSLSAGEDLIQIYQQAKISNPTLKQAEAERNAAYERINQSRGSLLPQLDLSGTYGYSRGYRGTSKDSRSRTAYGELSLGQVLFNMAAWRQLSIAEQEAAIQDISYKATEQQLILDTATAYFNTLNAIDNLIEISSQKLTLANQLEQTTQRFNVGLVAITDVHDAQAQYDNTLASEVLAKNSLDNALEELRSITGISYSHLKNINVNRFITTGVGSVSKLLDVAEKSNLDLLSARLSQELAREEIKLAQAGHLPTLSLSASSDLTNAEDRSHNRARSSSNTGEHSVGVTLSVPIYSGGTTSSEVKEAQYNYTSSSEQLEYAHRTMIKNVRSSVNNITASISTIKAYQQSVISAESSLKATRAGYNVGTRTIVDVLDATTSLYTARTNLSNARYDYLINQLNLKAALGSLTEQDLISLNNELGEIISTSAEQVMPTTVND